ncbi:MAG: hypothetical protein ACOXZJ_07250, partial [Bacteroidales bacterium]
ADTKRKRGTSHPRREGPDGAAIGRRSPFLLVQLTQFILIFARYLRIAGKSTVKKKKQLRVFRTTA